MSRRLSLLRSLAALAAALAIASCAGNLLDGERIPPPRSGEGVVMFGAGFADRVASAAGAMRATFLPMEGDQIAGPAGRRSVVVDLCGGVRRCEDGQTRHYWTTLPAGRWTLGWVGGDGRLFQVGSDFKPVQRYSYRTRWVRECYDRVFRDRDGRQITRRFCDTVPRVEQVDEGLALTRFQPAEGAPVFEVPSLGFVYLGDLALDLGGRRLDAAEGAALIDPLLLKGGIDPANRRDAAWLAGRSAPVPLHPCAFRSPGPSPVEVPCL